MNQEIIDILLLMWTGCAISIFLEGLSRAAQTNELLYTQYETNRGTPCVKFKSEKLTGGLSRDAQ